MYDMDLAGEPQDINGKILFAKEPVKQVHETRYLGFYLDYNLSWKRHSDVVATKVAQGVGAIRHFKKFLSSQILLLLYNALVHPNISYGCVLWSSIFYSNFK